MPEATARKISQPFLLPPAQRRCAHAQVITQHREFLHKVLRGCLLEQYRQLSHIMNIQTVARKFAEASTAMLAAGTAAAAEPPAPATGAQP